MKANNFRVMLMVVVIALCLAAAASADFLQTSITSGQGESSNIYGHVIGGGVNYTTNTGSAITYTNSSYSTDAALTNEAWVIDGAYGNGGNNATPTYPLTYVETSIDTTGMSANTVGVGFNVAGNTAYYNWGVVAWEVQAPAGQVFTGGTATLTLDYQGQYFTYDVNKFNWNLFTSAPTFTYDTWTPPTGGAASNAEIPDIYQQTGNKTSQQNGYTLTVNIPNGVSTFWLDFDSYGSEAQHESAMTAEFSGLSIAATYAAPVPEPGSLLALATGLVGLLGLAYRRK